MRFNLGRKPTMAFLVYLPMKDRRKNNSFVGNGNVGAFVVKNILEQSGYTIDFCVADNAHKFDIVLVSLTSTYDVISFYQHVSLLQTWQKKNRPFKVWAGGFGMQNPTAIREYVDWSFFGRVDDWLCDIAEQLINHNDARHDSLMDMNKMNNVKISQAKNLYGGTINVTVKEKKEFNEEFTGCPLKCKFCHYTFARKYEDKRVENRGSYVQTSLMDGNTPEVTWDQLLTWNKKAGRIRVAIDGCSLRMRKLYGKGFITNDKLIEGIERMGSFGGTTTILCYNIGNFPYETDEDRMEIEETLKKVNPKYRVIFVLYTTPFRPSLATPMQWEGVNIDYDWSKHRSRVIVDNKNFRAVHAFTLETPYSHFISVFAERMETRFDDLFHNIAMSKKFQTLKASEKIEAIKNFYDISPILNEREIDTDPPAPFLSSYLDNEVLRKIARKMRSQAKQGKWA